jgi:hypothetical protein
VDADGIARFGLRHGSGSCGISHYIRGSAAF